MNRARQKDDCAGGYFLRIFTPAGTHAIANAVKTQSSDYCLSDPRQNEPSALAFAQNCLSARARLDKLALPLENQLSIQTLM